MLHESNFKYSEKTNCGCFLTENLRGIIHWTENSYFNDLTNNNIHEAQVNFVPRMQITIWK